MAKPEKGSHAQGDNPVEKQASQLAYDVKYKVRSQLNKGTKMNPAQVAKAYLAQLAKSPAPPAVKAMAKKKLMGEEHTQDIEQLAQRSLVEAMLNVFGEEVEGKKYKIRVTDKKTGNTYVRNADRAKIAELRANPNISSVEITSHGEVSGDEKSKGKQTAAAKSGKDYDGDGKVESGAKEYRGAVHNAIQRKKGLKPDGKDTSSVKEEIIYEKEEKTEKKSKTITGEKVNNYQGKDSVVKIFPNLGEQALQKPDANEKRQLSTLQQFQNRERQLNQKKLAAQRSGKVPVGSLQVNSYDINGETVEESGDYWHPDPKKDAQISGQGNKQRAREDGAGSSQSAAKKEDPKKLRKGESYMDYAKRQGYKPSPKPSLKDKIKSKLGLNKVEVEIEEGLKQARKNVGADKCWDGYKAKGTKKKDGKEVPNCVKEEEIVEKAVSKAQQRFMGMVYAAKKGGTPASPEVAQAASGMSEKEAKKFAKTKHSKLPEKVSEEKEGCDCGKTPCECGKVVDDRETPTKMDLVKNKLRARGIKVSGITPAPRNMKTAGELGEERKPEVEAQGKKVAGYEKANKYQGIVSKFRKEHPGSRQQPKERGSKPTEGELTQARIKKHNQRVAKHGFTSKEKKESKAREKYDSPRD